MTCSRSRDVGFPPPRRSRGMVRACCRDKLLARPRSEAIGDRPERGNNRPARLGIGQGSSRAEERGDHHRSREPAASGTVIDHSRRPPRCEAKVAWLWTLMHAWLQTPEFLQMLDLAFRSSTLQCDGDGGPRQHDDVHGEDAAKRGPEKFRHAPRLRCERSFGLARSSHERLRATRHGNSPWMEQRFALFSDIFSRAFFSWGSCS